MMGLPPAQLRKAVSKAEGAYGTSILADLGKAITKTQSKKEWLERCIQAMDIDIPKAVLWNKIRILQRVCT
jgi:dihydroxyacetone kinase DhaKLM complex PTS-EIIA-like component DhaM